MDFIHIMKRWHSTRLALLAVALFQTLLVAAATPKVYISDFSIKAGETKTIAVNFDCTATNYYRLKGYITMPDGLTVEDQGGNKWLTADAGRGGALAQYNYDTDKMMFIRAFGSTFSAGDGAIGYIKVTATADFVSPSTITLSDFTVIEEGSTTEIPCETANATVTIESGEGGGGGSDDPTTDELSFSFNPATLTMTAGQVKDVQVLMSNSFSATGLQADLTVSTGLSIVSVTQGSRVAGWHYNSTTQRVFVLGTVSGNEGTVFTVKLKAEADFSGDATLTASNLAATNAASKSFSAANITLPITVNAQPNVTWSFNPTQVYLNPGEQTTVDVMLNSEVSLTGFNADLTLPTGITATVAKGTLIASKPTYNMSTGKIFHLSSIAGTEGQLFTLTLTASDGFTTDGQIALTNIAVTTEGALSINPDAITMNVRVKTSATVTAPTTKTLTYNGTAQELVNAGTATGGELQYSLDGTNYSTTIPTATNAGNYTIYYKVVGDAAHNDVAAATLTVTIAKAALTVTAEDKTVNYGKAAP